MLKIIYTILITFLVCPVIHAAYSNYNSILIGERAAGMGGAYTALSADTSAVPYYNPATLARMSGTSLSTTANLYVKPDISYKQDTGFIDASLRVNQGSIQPVPSSSGSVHTFGNFAFGLSILLPDYYSYAGNIESSNETNSYINIKDESLWIGGAIAVNVSKKSSIGMTVYYTARTYTRSISDLDKVGEVLTTQDKEFTQNSLAYVLGYHRELDSHWKLGLSHRFESLPINGEGSFIETTIGTGSSPLTDFGKDVQAYTIIPSKTTIGLAYQKPKAWTASIDLNYHSSASYKDLGDEPTSEFVDHDPVWNLNVGGEYYYRPWLAIRLGLYTNFSSTPDLEENPTVRMANDQIDMYGFSANAAIYTSASTIITLGGYYNGGSGYSHEQTGQEIKKVTKSSHTYSFLVGTAYQF